MELATAPLNLTVLAPCELPKFEPLIVTDVPMVPNVGVTPETSGIVPLVMDTLSKVAALREVQLHKARPKSTVCAMLIV